MKAPVIWTLLGLLGFTAAAAETQNVEEEIWRHRNLGKAFYENPATQYDAVGEFEKALALAPDSVRERVNFGLALLRAGKVEEAIVELEQAQKADPSIPHTWFNLGIAYKQASRYDDAIHQLVGMVERIDDDAISHYNLGVLYKLTGAGEKSLHHFERSTELDPSLAGPHFQLATAYRQAKRVEDSKHHMKVFRKLKKRNEGAAVPEDLEWSWWAEIYETLEPEAARPAGPAATLAFDAKTVATGVDAATSSLTVFDADGDGSLDLLHASGSGLGLLLAGEETTDVGLGDVKGVRAVAPGDFDNDGLKDLALVTAEGPSLWRNLGDRFERTAVALPAGDFQALLWVDYDHDYDLDLFLLGADQKLARNKGEAGFDEQTAQFPFAEGKAVAAARFDVVSDTQGADIAVSYTGKGGVLYRDRLGGNYEAVPLRSIPAGAKHLLGADVDHDGWTDLVAVTADRMAVLINSQRQTFRPTRGPAGAGAPMVFADLENRGVPELMTGAGLFRNLGEVRFEPWPGGGLPTSPKAVTSADFDSDGRTDLAAVTDDGEVVRLLNRIDAGNHWLRVAVAGTKNLLLAPGSEIEVKVGSRYQKRIYEGVPLTFGIGDRDTVDTVRISWPNGLIQNEAQKPANTAHDFKEAQRLSGSCPMIFTWNGEEFEFITDVLGVAPLGASAGEGEVFPVDHDEWIQIAGESLVARDGVYEIRITEELREVAYLDEVRLVAVDHPADLDVFINDKFKGPPFPEFRLFGTTERHYPKQALDHRGQDVRPQLASLDKTYPDGYERNMAGVAELHHLEMDFGVGAPDDGVLVLAGWVDWADGSTFLGAAQESDSGLVMPYLQVKDDAGRWVTVIEDMGIPAGKPKTIVVDLAGKFLSDSREVRIVTNLCVYWDEIFLAEDLLRDAEDSAVRMTSMHADSADLDFRGFARAVVHPQRKQPEVFVYADRRDFTMWNPTPGLYTRFGDVRSLLKRIDDRFVIMGSGDEIRLEFDAAELPDVPAGWRRDFLLFVDGWAKDGDANTIHSQTVGPLPHHGMPAYPYGADHPFPSSDVHNTWREFYNTRPALRLLRPLVEGTPAEMQRPRTARGK